ncbi:cleavage polyadenylation factor subunit fip1 [Xylographa soralifera]|nr:cleavage polyadenylation factor subunit fip1 [Xylographa soralifera]
MEEEEEDMYAPDEGVGVYSPGPVPVRDEKMVDAQGTGNEDEESEEDSDSDIDIITERQDGEKPEPSLQTQRVSAIKTTPVRIASPSGAPKPQSASAIKTQTSVRASPAPSKPGTAYPPYKTSNIDVDTNPIYQSNGKPITEIDMDADFPEDDKPWRKPGTDMTDYFNYGFDEFTWASYCLKQESLRKDITDQKKQMEDMQNFLGMPGAMSVPGMPIVPAGLPAAVPSMGGMGDMPPDLQQMMQQMMAQGMDPSQMDFNTFSQMLSSGGGNIGAQGYPQQGQQVQQSQQGQQGQQGQSSQQMGYGYGGGNAGAGNRNQGGRGQGRRW